MSLNGLDVAAVVEAHQAVLADPAGWFLLKYANRDTVDLLERGSGGVPEVRSTVEKYEEKSPLYGLLQYRRKKVILKYVPEGTSRLLQVRLTVQFQSVLETFTPHDTVFTFTAASELTESSLAQCTMLLPSAGSLTSSNSSLRRRRLDEITEDVEEKPGAADSLGLSKVLNKHPPSSANIENRKAVDDLPASAALARSLLAKSKESTMETYTTSPLSQEESAHSPPNDALSVKSGNQVKEDIKPKPEAELVENPLPVTPHQPVPTSHEIISSEALSRLQQETSPLSSSDSNSISQWSNTVAAYTIPKPKKKLGPRPHIETQHRPKTSDDQVKGRPVANLPTSIRVSVKAPQEQSRRPTSQRSSRSVPGRLTVTQIGTLPPLPSPTHIASLYKVPDSRPTVSRPASVVTEASTAATPEKLRLMKALQMRKRNMLLAQRASTVHSHLDPSNNQSTSITKADNTRDRLDSVSSTDSGSYRADAQSDSSPQQLQTSAVTTPMSEINTYDEHSTNASSFSSRDEQTPKRGSLSSDTSSSVTPKPMPEQTSSRTGSKQTLEASQTLAQATKVSDDNENGDCATEFKSETQTAEMKDPETSFTEMGAQGGGFQKNVNEDKTFPTQNSHQNVQEPVTARITEGKSAAQIDVSQSRSHPSSHNNESKSLNIPAGREASEVSDDESFMDELQNATVHEAKHISVARSPVTPVVSKSMERLTRTVSIPDQSTEINTINIVKTKSNSSRSVSTALPQWPPVPTERATTPLSTKGGLGSGISKRIKALEVLSNRDSVSPPRPASRETITSRSNFSFMKRNSFLAQQQPSDARANDHSRNPSRAMTVGGTENNVYHDSNSYGLFPNTQKGGTISVRARIIRDSADGENPTQLNPTEPTSLNLHRSPLTLEHGKYDEKPTRPSFSRDNTFPPDGSQTKSPMSERGRISFSSIRSNSQARLATADSTISRISLSSNKKMSKSSDNSSIAEEKSKGSRTSRLMKRMSNLASGRRSTKTSISTPPNRGLFQHDTIQEQNEGSSRKASISDLPLHVVDVGDVNVQFPDSLLWKRRFLRIDDQGNVIFSHSTNDSGFRGMNRKYHLSDFNVPSLPDLEREEMAWSIILDLKDGSCIQCACENKNAQQRVLQMLTTAHFAYLQLYGQ